jgi:hypothetical protein
MFYAWWPIGCCHSSHIPQYITGSTLLRKFYLRCTSNYSILFLYWCGDVFQAYFFKLKKVVELYWQFFLYSIIVNQCKDSIFMYCTKLTKFVLLDWPYIRLVKKCFHKKCKNGKIANFCTGPYCANSYWKMNDLSGLINGVKVFRNFPLTWRLGTVGDFFLLVFLKTISG